MEVSKPMEIKQVYEALEKMENGAELVAAIKAALLLAVKIPAPPARTKAGDPAFPGVEEAGAT